VTKHHPWAHLTLAERLRKYDEQLTYCARAIVQRALGSAPHLLKKNFVRYIPIGEDPKTYLGVVGFLVDPETHCWIWKGAHINGTPVVTVQQQKQSVRRELFAARYGLGDAPGLSYGRHQILNACGRKSCVNPEHATERKPKEKHAQPAHRRLHRRAPDAPPEVELRAAYREHGGDLQKLAQQYDTSVWRVRKWCTALRDFATLYAEVNQ